jgi:hypothetical protein
MAKYVLTDNYDMKTITFRTKDALINHLMDKIGDLELRVVK